MSLQNTNIVFSSCADLLKWQETGVGVKFLAGADSVELSTLVDLCLILEVFELPPVVEEVPRESEQHGDDVHYGDAGVGEDAGEQEVGHHGLPHRDGDDHSLPYYEVGDVGPHHVGQVGHPPLALVHAHDHKPSQDSLTVETSCWERQHPVRDNKQGREGGVEMI